MEVGLAQLAYRQMKIHGAHPHPSCSPSPIALALCPWPTSVRESHLKRIPRTRSTSNSRPRLTCRLHWLSQTRSSLLRTSCCPTRPTAQVQGWVSQQRLQSVQALRLRRCPPPRICSPISSLHRRSRPVPRRARRRKVEIVRVKLRAPVLACASITFVRICTCVRIWCMLYLPRYYLVRTVCASILGLWFWVLAVN